MRPNPRFRTYSTLGTYSTVAVETLLARTSRGNDLTGFEQAVKERVGAPFALCMPQARVGIFLAIRSLISPGQKVIMSPYTIYDVVNMVICAGGVPLFADLDRATCNLDPQRVEELLGPGVGAVLVTHLHGSAMDLKALAELCRQRKVPLVEDAAQAFGARVQEQPVGTVGDVGIYSFGLYKNINAFYGGMVVTRRKELHERLRAELAALPVQKLLPYLRRVGRGVLTEALTWPPFFRNITFRIFRYACLHEIDCIHSRLRDESNPHIKRVLPGRYLRQMRPIQPGWLSKHFPAWMPMRRPVFVSRACMTKG